MTDKKIQYLAVIFVGIFLVAGVSSIGFTPVSGYQSMTAEWYKVKWDYPREFGDTPYVKDLEGAYVTWDGDETDPLTDSGGWSNLNAYSAEVSDPKFDHNRNYTYWWSNDTVTASNPDGEARRYEYAIDGYTLNVNFATLSGDVGVDAQNFFGYGAEFSLELENNYESVFNVLGAEDAVSYILYAEVDTYEWTPDTAANHRILPTTDKFDIVFLDGTKAVPPGTPEEGSDLNFASLERYSHVALKFVFADFGRAGLGTDVTVHYVINLSILTIGRFDHKLTYVEAGENEMAPMGDLGLLDGIGAALGAGYGALIDGFVEAGAGLTAPLMSIAVIAIAAAVIIFMIKRR